MPDADRSLFEIAFGDEDHTSPFLFPETYTLAGMKFFNLPFELPSYFAGLGAASARAVKNALSPFEQPPQRTAGDAYWYARDRVMRDASPFGDDLQDSRSWGMGPYARRDGRF